MTQHSSAHPVQSPRSVWTCTGVSWRGGTPTLTMTDVDGGELSRPLQYGEDLGVELTGPRQCIGIWRGEVRSCPFDNPVDEDQAAAQCPACAAADPGRALARDARVDSREFRLYLATFGTGVLKVGITAVDRGTERLLEQGALAYTWLGQGSHPAVRSAEAAVAAAGMATERPSRSTKLAGWWQHGGSAQRREALMTVGAAAHRLPTWPTEVRRTEVDVVDHADLYDLEALPDHVDDAHQLTPTAVLSGRIRSVIGPEILIAPADQRGSGRAPLRGLVVNGRRLAGWPIAPSRSSGGGYTARPLQHSAGASTEEITSAQHSLF
jgi:hypothetical protein